MASSKPLLYTSLSYRTLETLWDTDDDAPGPRFGHTLTAVAATKIHAPRLILFGGGTALEDSSSSDPGIIMLAVAIDSVHSYDVLTRKWTRIRPAGEPPFPRASHAAAVGTMVVVQGGMCEVQNLKKGYGGGRIGIVRAYGLMQEETQFQSFVEPW